MEYELTEERDMLPEHLKASTMVFKVMYGDLFQTTDHIPPAYIGQFVLSFFPYIAYIWFIPSGVERASMLREARMMWKELRPRFADEIFCFVKNRKNEKFARAFGFVPYAEDDGVTYLKELQE